jgi:hypothetical protein
VDRDLEVWIFWQEAQFLTCFGNKKYQHCIQQLCTQSRGAERVLVHEIHPRTKWACELKCLVFTLKICVAKWSLMDVKGDYWSGGKLKIFSFSPKFGAGGWVRRLHDYFVVLVQPPPIFWWRKFNFLFCNDPFWLFDYHCNLCTMCRCPWFCNSNFGKVICR